MVEGEQVKVEGLGHFSVNQTPDISLSNLITFIQFISLRILD